MTGPRRQPLLEIWHGARLAEVRRALEASDFHLGCDGCEPSAPGDEATSFARDYDRFATSEADPAWPQHLDLALSNRCNLQCTMCNGDLSSLIRTAREGRAPLPHAYDDDFFAELRQVLPHLRSIHFKGGEPFLSSEAQRVWDDLVELGTGCEVTVTTNGTHLTERGAAYVRDLRMRVLVSIDAFDPAAYRAIRVGGEVARVLANLDRLQQIGRETGVAPELVFCLMASNVDQLGPVLEEAERRGLDVSVIWVDSPARFDLRRAGSAAIEQAAASLSEADQRRGDALTGRRRATWTTVVEGVGELARAHTAPAAAVPVVIEGAPPPAPCTDIDAHLEALAARCAGPVLRADTDPSGIWETIAAPAWAARLEPDGWRGSSVADTLTMMWVATGAAISYDTEIDDDGVRRGRLELRDEDGEVQILLALLVPRPDGGATLLLGPEAA